MKLIKRGFLITKLCFRILTYKISFKNFLSIFNFKFFKNKSEEYKNELKILENQGYFVVKNFLSKKECQKAVQEIKESLIKYNQYVHESDDKRIFGVENIIPLASELSKNRKFLDLGESLLGKPIFNLFTLAGYLDDSKKGSSGGGWHRDCFYGQFKIMLYLTNVEKKNGPFQIIPKSNKFLNIFKLIISGILDVNQYRISNNLIEKITNKLNQSIKTINGEAGDLIIFNPIAIHRGKPIEEGERVSLTNYYYPFSIDKQKFIKKFYPVILKR